MAWLRGFLCVIFGSKILKNRQKTCKNATHATRNATRTEESVIKPQLLAFFIWVRFPPGPLLMKSVNLQRMRDIPYKSRVSRIFII